MTNGTGQTSCALKVCEAGYYSVGMSCIACVPGKYSHYASTSCTLCPVGTAQHKPAESSCPTCAEGTHQPLAGQAVCVKKPLMLVASELLGQSSSLELAVGALAALAVVGTALAGVVVALRKLGAPAASTDEMEPLFSKV